MDEQTIIQAKNFTNREGLENHVRGAYGLTTDVKTTVIIKGTREELSRLQLTDTTIFWGISCEITDTPTEQPKQTTADRGARTDFGINGRTKKIK